MIKQMLLEQFDSEIREDKSNESLIKRLISKKHCK